MGCGGSQPVYTDTDTPSPLQTVASINLDVMCCEKGHTYVVDERNALVVGGKGVAVLDISDPANVMCVAKVNTGVLTRACNGRIAIIPNSKVALLTGEGGLCVLDFSDPPNTKVLKTIKETPVDYECGRLAIVDAETALIVGQLGVGVLDISNPQNVEQVAVKVKTGVLTSTPHEARIAIIPNSKVALVTGGHGLCVLDVSDPPNAKVIKLFKKRNKETGVLVEGGGGITIVDAQTALVVGKRGVAVLDIADPQNVQILSQVDPKVSGDTFKPGRPIILGTRALVHQQRGLAVVDFTDRSNVKTLAKLDTGVSLEETVCRTRYKLMADGRHVLITGGYGAAIVDISDLSAPAKVGDTINTGVLRKAFDAGQMLLLEEYALVVGDGRVATIGIKDPSNPEVMKPVSFEGDGGGGRLVAIGNMHFMLVGAHGVDVLKMTVVS